MIKHIQKNVRTFSRGELLDQWNYCRKKVLFFCERGLTHDADVSSVKECSVVRPMRGGLTMFELLTPERMG